MPGASEQTNEQGFKNKLFFSKESAIVVYLIALLIGLLATIPLFSSRSANTPLQESESANVPYRSSPIF